MLAICQQNELGENQSKTFNLPGGRTGFVVKKQGQYFAYENQCPHRGIELNWQPEQFFDSTQSYLQCSTHGALFNIQSGLCVAGPCLGEPLTPLNIEWVAGTLYWVDMDTDGGTSSEE